MRNENEKTVMRSDNTPWYVIQSGKGHEQIIKEQVEKIDTETDFRNIFKIMKKRYLGAWHEEKKPLYPGYFFAITDDPYRVKQALKDVCHFCRILGFEGELIPISSEERELLSGMVSGSEDGELADMSYGVAENDEIKVISGPLKGFESRIVRVDRHKRKAYLLLRVGDERSELEVGLEVISRKTGDIKRPVLPDKDV